jgi:hypothetical protein
VALALAARPVGADALPAHAQLGSVVTFLWLVALKPKKKVD